MIRKTETIKKTAPEVAQQKSVETLKYLYLRVIHRLQQRHQMLEQHFATDEALEAYVNSHPAKELINKYIANTVAATTIDLQRLAKIKGNEKLPKASDLSKYRALVKEHYVDVSAVFKEIPEDINICDYGRIITWLQKGGPSDFKQLQKAKLTDLTQNTLVNFLNQKRNVRKKYLENRWRAIIGCEINLEQTDALPAISEIQKMKAPVPFRPAWNNELYSREARRMGHKSVVEAGDSDAQSPETEENTTAPEPEDAPEVNTNTNGETKETCPCDIEKLYELAGARQLKQTSTEDPKYTFPGKLFSAEDIFYDFSVIKTIDFECGPCKNNISMDQRSLTAAKVLAQKAKTITLHLQHIGLDSALGLIDVNRKVVNDVNGLIDDVLNLDKLSTETYVREIKKRLKEMAGLMRLISRTQMFLVEMQGTDFQYCRDRLNNALNNLRPFRVGLQQLPSNSTAGEQKLCLIVESSFGIKEPPPAEFIPMSQNSGIWRYSDKGQLWGLHDYLPYLAQEFYQGLQELKDSARLLKDSVTLNYDQFKTDFKRLAEGIVHSAANGLALLLDEIAEQIRISKRRPIEGSKRLALQIIFRQNWHPEGYVQGKLVGYKNLIPNEKETVKRRTFIKTTRELTTAEDFAATRQDDYSRTQKETAEVTKETAAAFNFKTSASGHFTYGMFGASASMEMGTQLSSVSKATQSMLSESIMKGSASYSNKREVKIRELTEAEDVQEVTKELQNANQEITANYFYYQLLRQYTITVELNDIRPVILRARDVPTPAEVDDHFISNNLHLLIPYLPAQLSVDAQESVDKIEMLAKTLIRRRAEMDQRAVELELHSKDIPTPTGDPPKVDQTDLNTWREENRTKQQLLTEARQAYIEAEQEYSKMATRINRVIAHLRENIHYYMQFIWQNSPQVDQDVLLQSDEENFCGRPFPEVTQGLNRLGYYGNEEIFEYSGPSLALLDLMTSNMIAGHEVLSLPEEEKKNLLEYLKHYCPGADEQLLYQIIQHAFVKDPVPPEGVISTRRVQIAQDALVVETLPGQVPLMEGFKMAHRMLDVQKACLENELLRQKINEAIEKTKKEVEKQMLENKRRKKLLDEDKLGDPDIEKEVVVIDKAGEEGAGLNINVG